MEHYLEFKYLLNRTVDIGGETAFIPMVQKMVQRNGHMVLEPQFDMNKVHKILLSDEEPAIPTPEETEGMSEKLIADLTDDAHMAAREARKHNDVIRQNCYHYVKNGTIEIVRDPFKMRVVKLNDKQAVRPSELKKDVTEEQIAKRPKTTRPELAMMDELTAAQSK
jgi:hypothetical protein